ncbi:MAG TPA: transaldolase [Blastocatellia bacterium]|nr:transaldolase [Blastocatellia bacterium]
MSTNPLVELARLGQSIWYDNIERRLITSGELKRMIDEDDLRGVTSNPAIFEKAISGSDEYISQIAGLAAQGKSANEVYEALAVSDIRGAADLFAPAYEKTKGLDGYVSLECSPLLANDTEGTIEEARRLWRMVDRRNVMIKIPGTPAGIPAIEQCIYEGININITLLFSLESYERTIDAYLNGLNRRLAEGKPVSGIGSVASFFVSRIDTAVDKKLEELISKAEDKETKAGLQSLLGRVAIANAKMAYQIYKRVFHGERFAVLKSAGAMVQRPLWASTSVKNPAYGDVYYVEALIGPDTVNTLPPVTYTAFKDHGRVRITIEDNLEEEQEILRRLEEVQIGLADVTTKVLEDGVRLFVEPFEKLLAAIEKRSNEILSQQGASQATQK